MRGSSPFGIARAAWLLAAVILPMVGCAIIDTSEQTATGKPALPPIVPPQDAIELEVYFIDRPRGDSLIGDALWNEIDQISVVEPGIRSQLNEDGIRFGVAPSSPPFALQALLDLQPYGSAAHRRVGRRYAIGSGTETELVSATLEGTCPLSLNLPDGPRTREYETPRCVFRVRAERVQDGWARLEFLPEIHYGDLRMRPVATDHDWQYRGAQEIDPLFSHRFTVELNVGEIVVVGTNKEFASPLGDYFIRNGKEDRKNERLLV
ncbi:MAG: hypothetical protein ACF8TS_13455, partial [Maioricimonas sp. JB049]